MSARISHRLINRCLTIFSAAVFTLVVGCGEKEQIRSYTVAKEPSPPVAVSAAKNAAPTRSTDAHKSGQGTDRMLVAVLPAGGQAWFFKVVGPGTAVSEREKEIMEFLSSVQLENGRPRWDRPSGWKEDPAAQMRLATLWIPADGKPLEMSVMALPWRGTPDELLANVNRWRGQMQLDEIGAEKISEVTREVEAGDAKMTIVDLRGTFEGSGMMAPFAGGMPRARGQAAERSNGELPAGHPPVDAVTSAPARSLPGQSGDAAVPKFDAPSSWKAEPPKGIRRAVFTVAEEGQQAEVTVFDFATSSGPMMTDPLENVNRWRREVGLDPLKRDDLASQSESIEIDGRPATYVALIPDAERPEQSQAPKGTLAAMVTDDDRIWFIKMHGSRQLVTDQQDEFKAFIKSVKFSDGGGKTDGNQ
jgi:hypothetical protein